MFVKDAKDAARRWVAAEASATPGFVGAHFHGSIAWLPDDAELPATSDVDVLLALDDRSRAGRPGKRCSRGVVLDLAYLSSAEVRSPEAVLGRYHLAGSFRRKGVIADPTGRLDALQAAVARDYAKRAWVRRRCEHALEKVRTGYRLDAADPFPRQVNAWLFPAGITTHVVLTAGLRNPTVRRRYAEVRDLLDHYGHLDLYERLLELLGCARLSRERVERHLLALAEAFDAAAAVLQTPFFFASDLSELGRPIAIDGSRELIARGLHREAVFWLVATATRCQMVFAADTPALTPRFATGYRALLADLGIEGFADLRARRDAVEAMLPRVWAVAESIMAANPAIEG